MAKQVKKATAVERKNKKPRWNKERCKGCLLYNKCWTWKNIKNGNLQRLCEE